MRFAAFSALAGVDLEIRDGETVALAGENGAGKSTLIRCIAGDIAPTSGRRLLGRRSASAPDRCGSRRGVAVVWQDLALCDNLDVAANLLLGHEQAGACARRRASTCARASAAARARHPAARHDALVGTLSGGQRQLLAVARAMCGRAAAARARRADRVARRQRVGAGRGADRGRARARHDGAARRRTTSTRCSGSPTGSSSCATGASSPTSHAAQSHPDEVVALDLRPADATPRRAASSAGCTASPTGSPRPTRRRACR